MRAADACAANDHITSTLLTYYRLDARKRRPRNRVVSLATLTVTTLRARRGVNGSSR